MAPEDDESSKAGDKASPPTPAEPADEKADEQVDDRLAHDPEAAMAAAVLDPGHRPPSSYPDDSAFVRGLRRVDNALGLGEQVVLFGMLATMVVVACVEAIAEQMHAGFLSSFVIVRDATFSIAMLGAAFATYQQRNLSMDLVSRRLGHKARMILRMFLASLTIFASSLFLYAGWLLRSKIVNEPNIGTLSFTLLGHTFTIPIEMLTVTMIPLGAALIIMHSLIQILIESDYLARGKLSPERERVGH